MSTFSVPVVQVLSVEHHPNADKLSIIQVLGYTCISAKLEDGSHRYNVGDYVVYVPSNSVIPEYLLKKMGFWDNEKNMGTLSGADGNRVKPIRLRGVFSEGILFPVQKDYPHGLPYGIGVIYNSSDNEHFVNEGTDVSEFLGITKYEPPIPTHLAGEVFFSRDSDPVKYDIESYENYPYTFIDGENVVVTEKLHGTFTGIGIIPGLHHEEAFSINDNRCVLIYSKGLGAGGKCFKDVANNQNNVYVKVFNSFSDDQKDVLLSLATEYTGIHLLGETFGKGVQDLHYGQDAPIFRVFDVYLGQYPRGRYADDNEMDMILSKLKISRVPVLARFKYSYEAVVALRDGKDSISNSNVKEGVVVKPVIERRNDKLGRIQLKFVSPDYKTRKGKNITENQ